jgi:gamma-glutamyl-gamma-aminobutyrate hydrolase PuuD
MENRRTSITIETWHGKVVVEGEAETIEEIHELWKQALLGISYHPETVKEFYDADTDF